MSLGWIGPVQVDFHGDPEFAWVAAADASGIRAARISGLFEWTPVHQLTELVSNPHRRITVGRHVGVLEVIWFTDELLRPANGWYLLEDFEQTPDHRASVGGLVQCHLVAGLIGDTAHREIVITRSARARANDHGLTPASLAVNAFYGEDRDGERFRVDPGGTFFAREYDHRTAHDVSAPTVPGISTWNDPDATWNDPDVTWSQPGGRKLGMYAGTIT